MRDRRHLAGLAVALVAASVVAAVGALATASTGSRCPAEALPLRTNPITPAVAAVLRVAGPNSRLSVTGAVVAPSDTARGPEVKTRCGSRAWRRTVVVYAVDRALLPSASLSQRVYFVSRFAGGYRVWERVR